MTDQIPTFAVVGHPNKGKSSIVATLAEDDRVDISPLPGTTRTAQRHVLRIDDEALYVLVDTPGFQRPGELLNWLRSAGRNANDRPTAIREFVEQHHEDPRFADECELLQPLIDGAGILYVVDGAKPFGPEYELEMEILRWTGQPRMALINMIGEGNHQDEWRRALDQYFSIVRVFDALHADFDKRIALLRAFAELDEHWRARLETAILALQNERRHRRRRSAALIAGMLIEAMTLVERAPLASDETPEPLKSRLVAQLRSRISDSERTAQQRVKEIYRHASVATENAVAEILDTDLFTGESWQVFGLSRNQLAITGALSGAAAGGGIDLALGGASLLLGAGVGALIGGTSAWLATGELARVKIEGESLGNRVLQVGPVQAQNFPWVLLGRNWLHHHLIAERNHAARAAVVLAVESDSNLAGAIPVELRRDLARSFAAISKGDADFDELSAQLDRLLTLSPTSLLAAD
ncbi:MAG: DUF3482 domain-containing protein [Pseudomonadota bacterium]